MIKSVSIWITLPVMEPPFYTSTFQILSLVGAHIIFNSNRFLPLHLNGLEPCLKWLIVFKLTCRCCKHPFHFEINEKLKIVPNFLTLSCTLSQLPDWFQGEVMLFLFHLLSLSVLPLLLISLLPGRPVPARWWVPVTTAEQAKSSKLTMKSLQTWKCLGARVLNSLQLY